MFRVLHQHESRFALAACVLFLLCAGTVMAQTPTAQAQPRPKRPEAAPEVTSVRLRPVKFRVGQPCPADPTIFATIATNGAITAKYTWVRSGGKRQPELSLKFTGAGQKSVSTKWQLGTPGEKVNAWIQIQILSPNRMTSDKLPLEFTCTSKPKSKK